MGWSSGTDLFIDVWNEVRKHLAKEDRVKVMSRIIKMFENKDWDNVDEVIEDYPEAKEAILKIHPDFFEDEL